MTCPKCSVDLRLDAGEDTRILELMQKEKAAVEKEVGLEDAWANYINKLRSSSLFGRMKNLFK